MRVKGRDLYDYLFYLSRSTPVNLGHLNARLRQTGYLAAGESLSIDQLKQGLTEHFSQIDFKAAAQDVRPFIADVGMLDLWCADLFQQVTQSLAAE